jgi:ubiquinone/menaquinone biosynthesis C-methylase UbiE
MAADTFQKAAAELAFWRSRLNGQSALANDHYEHFYTTHFGWEQEFYRGKRILDIGCGPRGSLEWAAAAGLRIGADPLATAYRQLGTKRHCMYYVTCGAERLPFGAAAFDVVCAFNALDHVDDLAQAVGEIKRVLAPRGHFLLLSEIHRRPTVLEPSAYTWDIVARFQPELAIVEERHIEYTVFSPEGFGDIYQSLRRGTPYNHGDVRERSGILSARFCKRSPTSLLQ